MQESERYLRGKDIRNKVLGADFVAKAGKDAGEFGEPFQRIIAMEYAWGTIWARPGLELKIRSLCTVAMLTALCRPNEVALHIKGALNNGATEEEIREVLLQTAVYAGTPAAKVGFEIAKRVIDEYHGKKK